MAEALGYLVVDGGVFLLRFCRFLLVVFFWVAASVPQVGAEDSGRTDRKGLDNPSDTAVQSQIILPSNLNTPFTDGIVRVPIYAFSGAEILQKVEIQFRYSLILFSRGDIEPGPNFQIKSKEATDKGFFMENSPLVTLVRSATGEPGEKIADLTVDLFNFVGTTGGNLDFVVFEVDDSEDLRDSVPSPRLMPGSHPSTPVLSVPQSIETTEIQARWIPNPASEGVDAYHLTVLDGTEEIGSATFEGTETEGILQGLEPAQAYTLSLVASNEQGSSNPATLEFQTRYEDEVEGQTGDQLKNLSLDWSPSRGPFRTVQEAVPSPVDFDLNGFVNALDLLSILDDRAAR